MTASTDRIMIGTGMVPNILPAPKTLKLDGSPVMGTPSQATYTIPLAILNIPNVAIKGAIPPYAMMKPLIAPQVKPAAMAIRIAIGILTSCTSNMDTTILESPTTEPTERSMPPPVIV